MYRRPKLSWQRFGRSSRDRNSISALPELVVFNHRSVAPPASPPLLTARNAPQRLLRLKTKVHERMLLPPGDRHAAAEIQPDLIRQEPLKLRIIHLSNVLRQKNRRLSTHAVAAPRFKQERNPIHPDEPCGENSCVLLDGSFEKPLVILIGGLHIPAYQPPWVMAPLLRTSTHGGQERFAMLVCRASGS